MKGWIIKLTPENCLAIGGHTASWSADKATARDSDGYPIIPATALKGALSIEAERLFGEEKVKEVFRTGLLRFADAELWDKAQELYKDAQDGASPGYQRRVGVAISRRTRAVQAERLFDWETTAPFLRDAEFRAEVTCTCKPTEEQEKLLKQLWTALRVTGLAIGAAKSRGIGHFKFEEEKLSNGPMCAATTVASSQSKEYLVKLIPEEEFRTSRLKARQYLMETEDHIPGATFRGAVAKAIGYNSGDVFARMFKQTTVRFGPLYPSGSGFASAHPFPLSARTCKVYPGERLSYGRTGELGGTTHGLVDILLYRLCNPEQPDPMCAARNCGREMKPVEGYYYRVGGELKRVRPRTHLSTKLRIDRKRLAASTGDLFSYESNALDKDIAYVGLLSGIGHEDALAVNNLGMVLVGGARGRGFGKMKIEMIPATARTDARERMSKLQEVIAAGWPGFQFNGRVFFTLDLVSDLILPYGQSFADLLKTAIGDGLELQASFVREEYAGGYNAALGMPKDMMPAIVRGSCVAGSVPENKKDELIEKLERVEAEGLGLRRYEGYGRVLACDEFHLQSVPRTQEE